MIACYARGDGLGHLTRIRAALHTLGRAGEPVTILTDSAFAADPRVVGDWTVLPVGAPAGLTPDELIVDAFPAGLKGELTASMIPSGARVTHLARRLRWDAYEPMLPAIPPRFDRTFVLEPLEADHLAYLQKVSGGIASLSLVDPPAQGSAAISGWLIVHSGPDEEILELVDYAQDTADLEGLRPAFTLIAPRRPDDLPAGVAHLDLYPAWPLAAYADRIVTAAGFNAVRQLAPWRDRHRVVPFPRTLDDQFARAAAIGSTAFRSTSSTSPRSARS